MNINFLWKFWNLFTRDLIAMPVKHNTAMKSALITATIELKIGLRHHFSKSMVFHQFYSNAAAQNHI